MQLSGGSPLFYFKSKDELLDFEEKELKMPREELKKRKLPAAIKNIVLFVPDEHASFGYLFNSAECICDPRNPFYNREVAKKDALSIITNVEGVAGEFVRYAVAHNLLPDTAINSMQGEERGLELTQQNLDFLARTLRRQEY